MSRLPLMLRRKKRPASRLADARSLPQALHPGRCTGPPPPAPQAGALNGHSSAPAWVNP